MANVVIIHTPLPTAHRKKRNQHSFTFILFSGKESLWRLFSATSCIKVVEEIFYIKKSNPNILTKRIRQNHNPKSCSLTKPEGIGSLPADCGEI